MQKVTLNGKQFDMRRGDGEGEYGPLRSFIRKIEGGAHEENTIEVGLAVYVDNLHRWYCTSVVTEILEVNEDKTFCMFKTHSGSIYTVVKKL